MAEHHDDAGPPPVPESELVPEDDAIIGRAFWWSIGVLTVLAAAAVLVVWSGRGDDEAPEAVIEKDPGEIGSLPGHVGSLPEIPFLDVTASAGVGFVHCSGATGEKLLPETMGAGCAFLDFDGDGDQDLLLVNGAAWPWSAASAAATPLALYRNDGRGRFDDVTADAGLDGSFYGTGVAAGDWDGDGRIDLFVAALGPDRLYRNTGAGFEEVTAAAGVAGGPDQWSTSAGFFDADADGDLDLFVCTYVSWSRDVDIELNYTLNGVDRAYGPPTSFRGDHCRLHRNEGDGAFTDVSEAAGLHVVNRATGAPVGKALALCFLDVDDNGLLDVLVANDTTRNFLFVNQGGCRFVESGETAGVAYDSTGRSTGAMGIDAGFPGNDGDLAVGIGNFAEEMTSFFVRQADGSQFSDDAIVMGIGAPSRRVLSFGLFFFDADLDGRCDLLQVNGHLENEIAQVQASQRYRQPPQLFWNAGARARVPFFEVPADRVGDLSRPLVARGAAYADVDGDGDLDVLISQTGDRPALLRNDQASGHHWLRLVLRGRGANRDAIGATVELEQKGVVQRRLVSPTRSYLSQVELPLTFGLGASGRVDRLSIRWPDGAGQDVAVDGVDRTLVVQQADVATAARAGRGP